MQKCAELAKSAVFLEKSAHIEKCGTLGNLRIYEKVGHT